MNPAVGKGKSYYSHLRFDIDRPTPTAPQHHARCRSQAPLPTHGGRWYTLPRIEGCWQPYRQKNRRENRVAVLRYRLRRRVGQHWTRSLASRPCRSLRVPRNNSPRSSSNHSHKSTTHPHHEPKARRIEGQVIRQRNQSAGPWYWSLSTPQRRAARALICTIKK